MPVAPTVMPSAPQVPCLPSLLTAPVAGPALQALTDPPSESAVASLIVPGPLTGVCAPMPAFSV